MARLAYADIEKPHLEKLVSDIKAARGSVLHLYRMLLHSPPIAAGWLQLLSAIRQKCELDASLRELVIMRVALLNGAPYEADQHRPIALAEGVTQTQLDALSKWRQSALFDSRQCAVLALTDAMTLGIKVEDPIFTAVREQFDEPVVVELVVTIAAYNMVSRALEALQIHSDDQVNSRT